MLVGLSNKHREPSRRKRKKPNRRQRQLRKSMRTGWVGPAFTREPVGAPCFLGPGHGRNAIYVLVDTRSGNVVYVGKTVNVDNRFHGHYKAPHNESLRRWQLELKVAGLSPLMVVMDSAGDDWPEAERAWIAYYRRLGRIMNIEDGGPRSRSL